MAFLLNVPGYEQESYATCDEARIRGIELAATPEAAASCASKLYVPFQVISDETGLPVTIACGIMPKAVVAPEVK